MVYCTGCDREFTASGYSSHVTCTLNLACHAAYSQEMDALQGEDSDGHTDSESDGAGPHTDYTSLFHDSDGFFDDDCFEEATCKFFCILSHTILSLTSSRNRKWG